MARMVAGWGWFDPLGSGWGGLAASPAIPAMPNRLLERTRKSSEEWFPVQTSE